MTYPLPDGFLRATDDFRHHANDLIKHGVRQSHGVGDPKPLIPGQKRDLEIALRAIKRFYDADAKAAK